MTTLEMLLYNQDLVKHKKKTTQLTTKYKLTSITVRTRPSFQAGLVSVHVTGVVSKKLITWPTKLVAAESIVVFIAGDPDLVVKLCGMAIVGQPLPLSIRVDHARMVSFLYEWST